MARETKVGLLAGLAFIVVFAVILANRGREDPLLSQKPLSTGSQVVLGEEFVPRDNYPTSGVSRDQTGRASRGFGAERYQSAPIRMNGPFGAGRVNEERDAARKRPPGTRAIAFGDPPGESSQATIAASSAQPPSSETTRNLTVSREARDQFASEASGQLPGDRRGVIQPGIGARGPVGGGSTGGRHAKIPQRTADVPLAQPRKVSLEMKKPALSGTKYVVLAGDTLYAIAGKHYGKRGGRLVRAIVEANRDTLPDPNKLRIGAVLLLPNVDGGTKVAASSASAGGDGGSGAKTAARATPDFEWYQVRKGDRYASIAKKKLGDARRWREVFELNKEKFPDPDRIRDGVLIKIPRPRGGGQG